ncbi:MAG: hypothetical protein ABJH63_20245 [Rhizobiaceae bacterium]
MSNKLSTALLATAIILAPQFAFAKDWIQTVSVKSDGIDVVPIQVRAGANKFQSVKPQNHKFSLRIRAKAKSGKRIVAAKIGSHNGVDYFEAGGGKWEQRLAHRDVGSGTLRDVKRTFSFMVPTTKIRWKGTNAVDRCNKVLNAKIASGMSRNAALSKNWNTTAHAYFQLDAVAATKAKAKKNKWNISNTTNERAWASYKVNVRCLGKGGVNS